jgi:hypothetical protein
MIVKKKKPENLVRFSGFFFFGNYPVRLVLGKKEAPCGALDNWVNIARDKCNNDEN